MNKTAAEQSLSGAREFYCKSMELLRNHDLPFLVGGAYGFGLYTGIERDTKDFDLFVRPQDVHRILELFSQHRYRAKKAFPHWLAKIFHGEHLIDLIYRAGNGLCEVDDSWFARAREKEVLGVRAPVCAPEEVIWMKAYIMERERYDGADLAHLLQSCADEIDWNHLVARFGPDWRVLFSHLVLFGFIYPGDRHRIPPAVIEQLVNRLRAEQFTPTAERVCRGTLLSRAQYLVDVRERGLEDARLTDRSRITEKELNLWTKSIATNGRPPVASATE
jgi:hypothetical protein